MNSSLSTVKPVVTFTAGCPGSGKSTVMSAKYPGLYTVDADKIKESLPGYDPKNPVLVHDESSILATREYYARLGLGQDFCYDGTGKTVEKYVNLIAAAKKAGFNTRMIWVYAPLITCIRRNNSRLRSVDIGIVIEMHQAVSAAQAVLKDMVDEHIVIDNY